MVVSAPPSRVVELACLAPSVQNTQPWRWEIAHQSIALYSDEHRRLPVTDPEGRSLVISCGAALHHAQVAARALGWAPSVTRLPDGPDGGLLARVVLEPGAPGADAPRQLEALERRYTDRRRFTSWPIPRDVVQTLASTASGAGGGATALTGLTARIQVELLVSRAIERQLADAAVGTEQRTWVDREAEDGIPAEEVHPAERRGAQNRLSSDRLSVTDQQRVEVSDGLIVLGGRSDDRAAWLATGEGLSALWLRATIDRLSVVPLSPVVEVEETRLALHHGVLGGTLLPHLLVRLGWQPIGRSHVSRTSRRQLGDVLHVTPPLAAGVPT